MSKFVYSAFADEIDNYLDKQIEFLKKLNINFIEMRTVNDKNISNLTLVEANAVKEQLEHAGFKVSSLGSPIGKISIEEPFEKELEKFKHTLEISKILGVKYIRMFSFLIPEGKKPEDYYEEVLSRWQQYAAAAEGYDVTLLHENEKDIYGDIAPRCLKLLEALNSDRVGLTFDPSNFVQVGQDVLEAYFMLKQYIEYVHIKDSDEEKNVCPAGMGVGCIKEFLQQLKADGYEGYVTLEPHLSAYKNFEELEKRAPKKSNEEVHNLRAFETAFYCMDEIIKELD